MTTNTSAYDIRAAFHLNAIPFTRELAAEKRWPHVTYEQALAALRQVVDDRTSAAVIGPAGSGKTTLLRALAHELPEARYRVHYVKVTSISKRDLCRELAVAIGADPVGQYCSLVRSVQERLCQSVDHDGLRPILILDEAHDLRPDVLAIVRILTNFDMDSRLVVSIVLAGQPPLARLLQRDDLLAVSSRLSRYIALRTLGRDETHAYVEHRLTVAGAAHDLFDDRAQDALFEIAGGNLRATNHLALAALRLAAADKSPVVEVTHVTRARETLAP